VKKVMRTVVMTERSASAVKLLRASLCQMRSRASGAIWIELT